MSHRAAAAAAVTPSAGAVALPADSLSSRVYSLVHSTLRAHKMQFYSKQCTQDLLLVADGLRVSFVVDVFAPLNMWQKLLRQLAELSPLFSSLCVLDLCDGEGCLVLSEPLFREKLRSDISALQINMAASCDSDIAAPASTATAAAATEAGESASVVAPAASSSDAGSPHAASVPPPPVLPHYSGPAFVNVHPALRTPLLCGGWLRERYRSHLLRVCNELWEQLADKSVAPEETRCLHLPPPLPLPSHADDDAAAAASSLPASLAALSLTTVCGYLLDYPVLYCTAAPAASALEESLVTCVAATAGAASPSLPSSAASNNLGGCALMRFVLEAEPSATTTAAAAAVTQRTLVCSFTVPRALAHEAVIDAALQRWTQQRLSIAPPAHPAQDAPHQRWCLPMRLSHTAVELPMVSL